VGLPIKNRREKMSVIYEPGGRAREFAERALNIYLGCTHGCLYCYGPSTCHRTRDDYYKEANPRKDILKRLERDCKKVAANGDMPEIHLSFLGDVYQPAEMALGLTRQAIETLIKYSLPFTVLTKGGTRATRDFDLLENYEKTRFGTTLVFINQKDADEWEPSAASIKDRVDAIREAKSRNIQTWVSLEPVIIPEQALQVIEELHPIVDHWKVGKVNYVKTDVDWIAFREEVTALLDSVDADYYIKKSLAALC
jgi:DNA repair photolyase